MSTTETGPSAAPAINLFIASPTYGGMVATHFMASVLKLQELCMKSGVQVQFMFVMNESLITRGRNTLCHGFLQSNATHMLFLDADIGFHPEDILFMLKANVDVIGGAYPKKEINWGRVADLARQGVDTSVLSAAASNFVFNPVNPSDSYEVFKPNEVMEVGTGLLLIKREVLEKMKEHFKDDYYTADDNLLNQQKVFRFFDTQVDKETNRYISEDYMFSKRWREMGGKIYLAPWTRTQHCGMYGFVGDIPKTTLAVVELQKKAAEAAAQSEGGSEEK
jgi:hypothetical protein